MQPSARMASEPAALPPKLLSELNHLRSKLRGYKATLADVTAQLYREAQDMQQNVEQLEMGALNYKKSNEQQQTGQGQRGSTSAPPSGQVFGASASDDRPTTPVPMDVESQSARGATAAALATVGRGVKSNNPSEVSARKPPSPFSHIDKSFVLVSSLPELSASVDESLGQITALLKQSAPEVNQPLAMSAEPDQPQPTGGSLLDSYGEVKPEKPEKPTDSTYRQLDFCKVKILELMEKNEKLLAKISELDKENKRLRAQRAQSTAACSTQCSVQESLQEKEKSSPRQSQSAASGEVKDVGTLKWQIEELMNANERWDKHCKKRSQVHTTEVQELNAKIEQLQADMEANVADSESKLATVKDELEEEVKLRHEAEQELSATRRMMADQKRAYNSQVVELERMRGLLANPIGVSRLNSHSNVQPDLQEENRMLKEQVSQFQDDFKQESVDKENALKEKEKAVKERMSLEESLEKYKQLRKSQEREIQRLQREAEKSRHVRAALEGRLNHMELRDQEREREWQHERDMERLRRMRQANGAEQHGRHGPPLPVEKTQGLPAVGGHTKKSEVTKLELRRPASPVRAKSNARSPPRELPLEEQRRLLDAFEDERARRKAYGEKAKEKKREENAAAGSPRHRQLREPVSPAKPRLGVGRAGAPVGGRFDAVSGGELDELANRVGPRRGVVDMTPYMNVPPPGYPGHASPAAPPVAMWVCRWCTYENCVAQNICEICKKDKRDFRRPALDEVDSNLMDMTGDEGDVVA